MLLTLCDRRYRRSGTVWEGGASGGISLVEYRSNALGEIDYCIGVIRRASAEFHRMINRSANDSGLCIIVGGGDVASWLDAAVRCPKSFDCYTVG